mgnify:CR=1 FL=1
MYIVSTGLYRECFTDFVIKSLDDVGDLLMDEGFLAAQSFLFEEGITGFRFGEERSNRNLPVELIVQYWDGYDYEETILYLYEVKLIGESLCK